MALAALASSLCVDVGTLGRKPETPRPNTADSTFRPAPRKLMAVTVARRDRRGRETARGPAAPCQWPHADVASLRTTVPCRGKAGDASGESPDAPEQRALRSEAPADYDDSGIERQLVVMDLSSCLRWFSTTSRICWHAGTITPNWNCI